MFSAVDDGEESSLLAVHDIIAAAAADDVEIDLLLRKMLNKYCCS